MNKIALVSHVGRNTGGMTFLFPLFRWEKELNECKIKFKVFTNHKDKRILNYEKVILIHRYFSFLIRDGEIPDRNYIKDYIHKLKVNGTKVIFFDSGDSSGSDWFDVIELVDLFLKKQLLIDKGNYIIDHKGKNLRVWINTENEIEGYTPCNPNQLHKIKVAWNIGLSDFRYNPLRIGLLSNRIFTKLKTTSPLIERKILTAFRGSIHSNNIYSFQRNYLINTLLNIKLPVIIGNTVNRRKYLKELEYVKTLVSPYGWGEICYRDFEAFIKRNILIKPDMSHLETFPNFYIKDQTYLSISWSMEDLEETLTKVQNNYKELIEIAITGQRSFIELYNNSEMFVNHIKNLIH